MTDRDDPAALPRSSEEDKGGAGPPGSSPGGPVEGGKPGSEGGGQILEAKGFDASSPLGPGDSMDFGRLFRWSWVVVRTALKPFLLATGLALLVQTLGQYSAQLLSSIMSLLGGAESMKEGGDFLDAIVPRNLQVAAILLIALLFVRILLDMGQRILDVFTENVMSSRLQMKLHDKLLRLGPEYHRAHDVGGTSLVVSQYASGAQVLFADLIRFPLLRAAGLVTALIFLVGNLQKLGDTPLLLTLALVGTLLLLPLGTWGLSRRVRRAYVRVRDSQKEVSEEILNSLSQPTEIQVLGAEEQRSASFAASVTRLVKQRLRAAIRLETVSQFQMSVPDLLQALFLAYGVFVALNTGNRDAAGPILALYLFVPQVVNPLQDIMQFYVGLQASWAEVKDVVDVLEAEEQVSDREDAEDAPSGVQSLGLHDVVFRYAPDLPPVLDGVSHTFDPTSVTALVARSGGGKSTLFHLLTRLYDPMGGTIRFGGKDIRDLHLRSYRRRVAKVSQFPLFIFDTIRANLRLADADATDAEMRAACEQTGLWEILERVAGPGQSPLDYVLPRAQDQGLSGGERRWLSITRALLTEPAVMLLDEPTTGIDALGRETLERLVRELGTRLSVIVVDHNVREFVSEVADVVCVLEDGHLAQVGTPSELARVPGLFRSLYLHGEEGLGGAVGGGPGAGMPDGGMPDGGKSDAGKSDGGKSDAGKSDAGKSDGGKSDAGKSDAGKG